MILFLSKLFVIITILKTVLSNNDTVVVLSRELVLNAVSVPPTVTLVTMAGSLGACKLFILDKYFTELQKHGDVQLPGNEQIALFFC